ncbi:MAG: cytochrome c3 family protein, partial [Acidobacteriota bacterium]
LFVSILVSSAAFGLLFGAEEQKVALQGKGKELCVVCHEDLEKLATMKFQHTPLKQNDCFVCHDPHTADHKGLVREEDSDLCYRCHEAEKGGFSQGVRHSPIETKGCQVCHHPHASNYQDQLLNETSPLCFQCHQPELEKMKKAVTHAPFVKGECMKCHSPHSSANEFLMKGDFQRTCLSCHNATQEVLVRAHSGMDVRGSDCEGCHTAHASDVKGLIHEHQNQPFRERECSTCHKMSLPDLKKLVSETTELCLMCHEEKKKGEPPSISHKMELEKGCSSCHTPHASASLYLFRRKEWITCLNCHTEVSNRFSASKYYHPSKVEGGRCSICHSIHSGKNGKLLALSGLDVCNQCHGAHFKFSHPMGKNVRDVWHERDELLCTSCHDPHGTNYRAFLRLDPARELCIQCHKIK